jgi:hypothetical protein
MTVVYRDERQTERHPPWRYTVLVMLLCAGLLGVFFVWHGLYVQQWSGRLVQQVTRVIPVPAASLNGRWISYQQALQLAHFQGAEEVHIGLERALTNEALRQLTKRHQVHTTADQVEPFMEMDASLVAYVFDELGWKERQYRRFVARPLAQASLLEEALWQAPQYQQEAKERAEHVLSQHQEIGIPFADLIDQYGTDLTFSYATDVGYVSQEELPEPFRVAWEMEVGDVSALIETERTFSYVYVYDAVEDEEGMRDLVAMEVLSFWKSGIGEVIDQFLEESTVRVFLR